MHVRFNNAYRFYQLYPSTVCRNQRLMPEAIICMLFIDDRSSMVPSILDRGMRWYELLVGASVTEAGLSTTVI